jgi:polysaccharide biosynthesis transport protein
MQNDRSPLAQDPGFTRATMNAGNAEFSPIDLLRAFFRHWRKACLVFVSAVVCSWLALALWPRTYQSETRLFIRVGRESVSLDPTATTGETLILQKPHEEEINSALEILKGRRIAERVVDRVGVDKVLMQGAGGGDWLGDTLDRIKDVALRTAQLRDDISDREAAVRRLKGSLDIFAPKRSAVIGIIAYAESPELAREICQAVADVYLEEHARVTSTEGSYSFFVEQSRLMQDRLESKVEELKQFKQRHHIVSPEGHRAMLNERIADIEVALDSDERELQYARAKMSGLKQKIEESQPELVSSKATTTDPTWSAMRQRLYELQLQEKRLAAEYTDEHPQLIAIRMQQAEAEKILATYEMDRVNETTSPSANRLSLERELLGLEAEELGLIARKDTLHEQREEIRGQLEAFGEQDVRIADLQREIAQLESTFLSHQQKLEEARIGEALGAKGISNVNIAQPATWEERPVKPQKRIIAVLALFAALAGSVGTALIAEHYDSTLRTPRQIESALGLPVIGSIAQGRSSRRKRNSQAQTSVVDSPDVVDASKRLLRSLLMSAERNRPMGSVGVLGCGVGAGGSTLCSSLAAVAARDFHLNTLLLDADQRTPFVSRRFSLNGNPGLSDVLSSRADTAQCVQSSGIDKLALISVGSSEACKCVELDPRQVGALTCDLKTTYDLTIVDLPSAASAGDGVCLAAALDHVVLVVEAETTSAELARRVCQQLKRLNGNVHGVVLNKTREPIPLWLRRCLRLSLDDQLY